jgi:lysophospholipase L1-like esterase
MKQMLATFLIVLISSLACTLFFPTIALAGETCDAPSPKLGSDGKVEPHFLEMHQSFVRRGQEAPIGLLFIGDSITEGWHWDDNWRIFRDHFDKYIPANFGIGGDRTAHVLWRIDNGELDHISPKLVVVMIGTNNIGYPAADILKGDEKIVAEIHQKLPDTKLLILGIFPRGENPADPKTAEMRDKIKFVNVGLAKLNDGSKTRFVDIGQNFLKPDGTLPKEIMPDALHPNHTGYEIWANAIQPIVDDLMK